MVGIIPLFAAEVIDDGVLERLPGFGKRTQWFSEVPPRPGRGRSLYLTSHCPDGSSRGPSAVWPFPRASGWWRVLRYVLDEREFLAPYGIRALSRAYRDRPYVCDAGGERQRSRVPARESEQRHGSAAIRIGGGRSGFP